MMLIFGSDQMHIGQNPNNAVVLLSTRKVKWKRKGTQLKESDEK
jgi:hypothetical protein